MRLLIFILLTLMMVKGQTITIAAAGDIACTAQAAVTASECQMMATSDLILKENVEAVLILGDLQYPDGALSDFESSYDLSWGRLKRITYPSPGNHEYHTNNAQGYFDYFDTVADQAYYSFILGNWHILSLNSNCDEVACDEDSEQLQWLESELKSHTNVCTLAFWHHPRFSSGPHGDSKAMTPFWNVLYNYKTDVILSGHDHLYERFPRQDWDGQDDPMGPRQFVVGTGGKQHYKVMNLFPQSELVYNKQFGVLFLTLEPTSYSWRFVTIDGEVIDQGQEACVR
jgi:acid phosphatase type 7